MTRNLPNRALFFVLSITTACGSMSASGGVGGSVPAINTADPVDELTGGGSSLAQCATGDVAANLAIVSEIRDSYHEMIVCGGLAMDFNSAVIQVLVSAALGRGRGVAAFSYQGNGLYAAGNGMMAIQASVAGADGGQIAFDILDPQSYLVGFTVNANGAINAAARGGSGGAFDVLGHAAGELDIQFQAEGPGFALLGLSPSDFANGRLKVAPGKIAQNLADHINLATRVTVDNAYGGTTVHYLLDGKARSIRDTMGGRSVPMELASITATRPETGQTIRITEWTMQYLGDGSRGMMDGTIGMEIDGGAFPYKATFVYPHRKEPDVHLACR